MSNVASPTQLGHWAPLGHHHSKPLATGLAELFMRRFDGQKALGCGNHDWIVVGGVEP